VMDAKCRQRPTAPEGGGQLCVFVECERVTCTHSRTWYHSVAGLRGVERAVNFVDSCFECFDAAAAFRLRVGGGSIAQAHRRVSLAIASPRSPLC
jgi:hypothetical protein